VLPFLLASETLKEQAITVYNAWLNYVAIGRSVKINTEESKGFYR